jgi:putative NADH-flavin reductase
MKIVIFGATGKTGTELVKQALEEGHIVTAFVRDVLKLTLKHEHLRAVTGSVSYPQLVDKAVEGQDAVLVALGSSSTGKTTVRSEGTKHIIAAMQKYKVKRLIVMTTLGTHESWQQLSFAAKAFFGTVLKHVKADHELQEDYVSKSGLAWTIVRPGGLTEGPHTSKYKFASDTSLQAGRVARADVAEFMLKQLTDDSFVGKAVAIS